MSREIKFRAWHKHWKKYVDTKDLEVTLDEVGNCPNLIFEQFTGLHDKNGKEIYEGDILRWASDKSGIYEVVFRNGAFMRFNKDQYYYGAFQNGDPENLEIIGNIHENWGLIELLKAGEE